MTALAVVADLAAPGGLAIGQPGDLVYVFGGRASAEDVDAEARRLARLLDQEFLAGAGWDPVLQILEVPPGHRLLGWQPCRVAGCMSRGDGPEQVCLGCRLRLAANGLGLDELDLMPARGWQRPEQCQVAGCPRTWRTPQLPLCRAHLHQQREVLRIGLAEFLAHPDVGPLPPCGPCQVAACVRDRDGTSGAYCSRRGRRVGGTVQAYVNSVARLSESLRARPDGGQVPAALGRADVENFLNRLAFQQSAGQISLRLRERICRDLRQVLEHVRAVGLTRNGQPAAGLSDDFALLAGDVPHPPQPGEPSRDLPAEIIGQLCGHLDELEAISSRRMRVAVELLIDTGRRPEEICAIGFDCLDRDSDGAPVLVYDNYKAARLGRRLPVSEATAQLVADQQAWTRARFPQTPAAGLKLLPTVFANPDGRKGIRTESLSERHRTWADALPPLLRADGSEYDKAKITLYAYRHTRPAVRRRRRPGGRAARADGPPAAGRDPPVLPGRRDAPTPGRRPGGGDAVRPARQPHLAAGQGAAGLRARPPRRRRGRRPVRGLRRAVQRQGRRAGLPVPVPLRGLRPLPHC